MSDPVREALRRVYDAFAHRANVEGGDFGPDIDLAADAARAALVAPSAVGELTAAMRECPAMFDSHMGALYGRGHDVPLAAGVELIRRKFVALIAKYGAANG